MKESMNEADNVRELTFSRKLVVELDQLLRSSFFVLLFFFLFLLQKLKIGNIRWMDGQMDGNVSFLDETIH